MKNAFKIKCGRAGPEKILNLNLSTNFGANLNPASSYPMGYTDTSYKMKQGIQ